MWENIFLLVLRVGLAPGYDYPDQISGFGVTDGARLLRLTSAVILAPAKGGYQILWSNTGASRHTGAVSRAVGPRNLLAFRSAVVGPTDGLKVRRANASSQNFSHAPAGAGAFRQWRRV